MKHWKLIVVFALAFHLYSCDSSAKKNNQLLIINKADKPPIIDGVGDDSCWQNTIWLPLQERWLGAPYSTDDFEGYYKVTWNADALYVLVKIHDDILLDDHKDPLDSWWDDDCIEVFIDEDNSGGEHQYNYNAFAYHISLTGDVIDYGPGEIPHNFKDHVTSKRITTGKDSIWELKILLFDNSYSDENSNQPVSLTVNKEIGFAIAYCDNDHSKTRENFIGSVFIPGEDKNRGYIDAGVFGTLLLKN